MNVDWQKCRGHHPIANAAKPIGEREKTIGTGMMFFRIILPAILASVTSLATPAAADLIWGVNGHPLMSYPDVTIEQQLDYVKDLGMKSYRVDIPNGTKAPQLRKLMIAAKAREIEILPVVTPDFDMDELNPELLHKQAYDLGFNLASQFKGEVRVWELANEFENYAILKPCETRDNGVQYSCLFGSPGGIDPLDYYGPRWVKSIAVVKGLTEGVRAGDPKALRAVGTAGWGHIGAFERMYKDGADWDISVWHMYGQDPEWALKKLIKYGHPIWITEFNYPLGSTKSEQEQADGLANAMKSLRNYTDTYNIQAAHIYELLDEPYWASSYEAKMGLIRVENSGDGKTTIPKIAYERVKQLIAFPDDLPTTQAASQPKADDQRHCQLKIVTPGDAATPKDVVKYSYCLVLGREADGAGLAGWSSKLGEATRVTEILAAMLQSDEFAHNHNVSALSTKDYILLLYHTLFGKGPDKVVLEKLAGDFEDGVLSRTKLQEELINSPELKSLHPILFSPLESPDKHATLPRTTCELPTLRADETTRRAQIAYGYCLVLGRRPEIAGLNSYNTAMLKGLTIPQFLSTLMASAEFQKKYSIDRLDNVSFVTLTYRLLLQRDPDGAGLTSYVERLDKGELSRNRLSEAIIASDEFRNRHSALFVAIAAIDPAMGVPLR